ncbi:HIT family protein [Actinokineospora sp. NPDC004072]
MAKQVSGACAFCRIISGDLGASVVHEDDRTIAFLDHRPLFRGHTLLIPKLHVLRMSDLPADRVADFFLRAQCLERAIESATSSAGSLVLLNNVVSQSVPHMHLHVIPRNPRDGLRFWLGPRVGYDAEHPAEDYAERIRTALAAL